MRGRLDHENVLAADVFMNFDENFHIGETPDIGFGERAVEIGRNSLGKWPVGVTGQDFHSDIVHVPP